MTITILGLGPGNPNALTLQARDVLEHADEIFLRTREHPTVGALPPHLKVHSFDHLYETLNDFDAIYSAIATEIVARGERGDVLYAVPGNPLFGESSVQKILALARAKEIATRLIAGLSFVDAACAALALDPLARGLQVADATDLARQHFPHLDPDQPVLVGQVYSRAVASDCKLTLLALYPPDHPVTRVEAAGTLQQNVETIALAELDRTEAFGLLTTLYVPPLPLASSVNALAEVIARLRAPDGCPWDREQTHQSVRKDFLEECYEVLETLDEGDVPHLREELGDLLFHVLFQAQIASESGEFLLTDVTADIAEKLIRRHPHVFGGVAAKDADAAIESWESVKRRENGGKAKPASSISRGLPALARAQKLARRRKVSADLHDVSVRVEKLPRVRDRQKALGEILFALAAYAGEKHLDAESALRAATK